MENELLIRKADTDDINTIGFLAQSIWPAAYRNILSPEQIGYMLRLFYHPDALLDQMTRHTFLLAELDEEPMGFASYGPAEEEKTYKLHKLYVLDTMQGKGIGTALLQFIVDELRELDVQTLDLNVNRHNKARAFYERAGFTVLGEEDIDIGNNFRMNDYVMRLDLRNWNGYSDLTL